ncbi:hypothetical protein CRM22_001511 [Opisthorchis felineus]|uniref:Uncharacterized protein n=1 Tax=Opisthorchis felineus TaxID=147828 RepID=A0A4S2MGS5_OPIFE|nr:hypothetical protein CRM22_001511 [Opisthorchis felineus]
MNAQGNSLHVDDQLNNLESRASCQFVSNRFVQFKSPHLPSKGLQLHLCALLVMTTIFTFCTVLSYFVLVPVCADVDERRCKLEAAWGPWRCPGEEHKCTHKNATRYKCIGGNCTIDDPCANLAGFQETNSCSKMLSLALCVPWWASWSSWTKCTAICGFMESTRFRPCIGAWTTKHIQPEVRSELQASCAANIRAAEGVETRDCPIRRLCPNIHGGWGEWTEFTPCSVTCGTGFRHRMRLCNRPEPRGNGLRCQGIDTQQVPCEGPVPCPKRGEWCPWSTTIPHCSHPCGPIGMGLRTRLCACPKPSYGGEACEVPPEAEAFAKYESTKKPGSGVPAPTEFAIHAIRTGQGRWEPCNRHPCPYLKFLKEEEERLLLKDLLAQRSEDAWVWSGGVPAKRDDPVQLYCPPTKESRLNVFDRPERFPKSRAYWTKSVPLSPHAPHDFPGEPLENTKTILIEGDRLTIRSLQPYATGVYRYGYEYEPGYYETVCFFVIYIQDSVWDILHGSTFDLTCNALGLWPIIQKPQTGTWTVYWDVRLENKLEDSVHYNRWWVTELMKQMSEEEIKMLNQTTNATARAIMAGTGFTLWDTEYRRVYRATSTMNGNYTCTIYNNVGRTLNRSFYTESFILRVTPPPTIFELVKLWCIQNQWQLTILVIVGLVSSVLCALCLWRRSHNIARLEIQTRELIKAKKAINLADLDAKID